MAKAVPASPPVELECADETLAREMARWLTHLRAERRLSPKTLEAYARDLRQCLVFLSQHWGARVTLARVVRGLAPWPRNTLDQNLKMR